MLASPTPCFAIQDSMLAVLETPASIFPLSSCSQEAKETLTFDWSDFPIVRHSSVDLDMLTSTSDVASRVYSNNARIYTVNHSNCPNIQAECSSAESATKPATCIPPLSPSTSSSHTQSDKKKKTHVDKKVRFSNLIQVRIHEVTLGEHPSCLGGMALECGWSYDHEVLDLDLYESAARKRRQAQLRLSYPERRRRLMNAMGLTGSQLLQKEFEMMCGGCLEPLHLTPSVSRALMSAGSFE